MNRRNFIKVMGISAGATALGVTPLVRGIDALAAAPTATPKGSNSGSTPTAIPSATDLPGGVPAPASGLKSNSNYYLTSGCNPITGLSVTLEITKDTIADIGFSIQLNAYSPTGANCVWQQYGMSFDTTNGSPLKIAAWVDNWPSDTFRQSLNLPSGSDLINNHGDIMLNLPSATLPAGYKFTVSLEYDKDQNVSGAHYIIVDNKGKSTTSQIMLESLMVNHSNPPKHITTDDLAPIHAFQLNLVGPTNGENTFFSAGAGTITYTATSPLTVMNTKPDCMAAQGVITLEIANSVYGMMLAGPSQKLTQSFDIDLSHPYALGLSLAVSQQFDTNQTALFAIDRNGQLGIFYVRGSGHWQSAKAQGPPELARPGAGLAVSQHFGIPNRTDVFVVDQGGQLNVLWAESVDNWKGPQKIGAKNFARTGANLVASQHFGATNQTDVFVVTSDGQLNMFWSDASGTWNGPKSIGSAGLARSGAALAVSQRFGVTDQTDVFVVDTNGQLNVFSGDAAGHWSGPQTIGSAGQASSAAPIAVSQHFGTPNQTDVFVVDKKGQLNVFSVVASGSWTGPQTIGSRDMARDGAWLAASQDFGAGNQTNVFLIDKKGQLNVVSTTASGQWSVPVTIGQPGFAPSGAFLVASGQSGKKNQTDLFCIGQVDTNSLGWPTLFWAGSTGGWFGPKELVNEV